MEESNRVRVADEVWVATALLHREHPEQVDFTVDEIVQRAKIESITGKDTLRPSIKVYAYQHCVANFVPSSGRYRMFVMTTRGRRRLVKPGDPCHAMRVSGKQIPVLTEIPVRYRDLIDWYHREYVNKKIQDMVDPILSLRRTGQTLWKEESADAYVQRLREGWK